MTKNDITVKEPKRYVVSDTLIEMIFFSQILKEFMPQLELVKRDNKDTNKTKE